MSNILKLARVLPATTSKFIVPRALQQPLFATKRFASSLYQPQTESVDDILQYREKPESLSYFTGNFKYNDLLIELDALYKKHEAHKPENLVADDKVYSWKLRDKMSELLAIPLTTSQWRKITLHLNALASLPKPLPAPVEKVLKSYERFSEVQQEQQQGGNKVRTLDDWGRAYAVGRRKESSASCYLVEGEGQILVNGKELNEYFKRSVDRDQVKLPLEVTENAEKFNAWILVKGGGTTGQAEAIKLGLGRALLIHDNELKPTLRKAGCITRDPRVVERKKEGQRKARAKYTWVKR